MAPKTNYIESESVEVLASGVVLDEILVTSDDAETSENDIILSSDDYQYG